MPDITKAAQPVGSPTYCFRCRGHKHADGFAYGPEIQHYGIVWECAQCCRDLGKAFGMVPPERYEEAVAALARSEQKLAAVSEALELEKRPESKVISIAEIPEVVKAVVIDLEKERAKRRPATPKAAGA